MFRQRNVPTFVLLLVAALAAVPVSASQGERKNLQVFNDVADTVLRYPRFTIFDDVAADVVDGSVLLTGRVTMPYKRTEIEKRIRKVEGVTNVENRIAVLPVSRFDDELRYVIARAIYGNAAFWHYAAMANPPIHIVVERGHVTLTGVVNSNVERMLARSLASSSAAFSVKNQLRTDAEVRAELELMGQE